MVNNHFLHLRRSPCQKDVRTRSVYWQFPGRESEDYFCAFPDCTLSPDRSVLGFDQGPGNGQPQPGAPAFAVPGFIHPVEALKDLRQMILGYTRTAVNNRA